MSAEIIKLPRASGTPAALLESLPLPEKITDLIVIVTTEEGTRVAMSQKELRDVAYGSAALQFELHQMLAEDLG